jgi:hypothetical protein
MKQISTSSSLLGVAPLAFARGSWIMVAFCAFLFVGVVIGYYTQKGSGITPRPYGKIYGGAPGAFGPGDVSGHDPRERVDWSRGTR